MRIIQITDLHIAPIGQSTILDIDVRAQFQSVLAKAQKEQPDLLVVSGDLCYDVADEAVYLWIKKELDQSGLDYWVMAGNHDDSTQMAQVFGYPLQGKTGECYYAKQYDAGKILFLDSAKAVLSKDQWTWLEGQLVAKEPIMIFMHHPPVLAQTPFMDNNYSFKEIERFAEVLAQNNAPMPIFCGHYHIERFIQSTDFNVFITPSTMAQIDGSNPDYALSHLTPGFRMIDWDGEKVVTAVEYLW